MLLDGADGLVAAQRRAEALGELELRGHARLGAQVPRGGLEVRDLVGDLEHAEAPADLVGRQHLVVDAVGAASAIVADGEVLDTVLAGGRWAPHDQPAARDEQRAVPVPASISRHSSWERRTSGTYSAPSPTASLVMRVSPCEEP